MTKSRSELKKRTTEALIVVGLLVLALACMPGVCAAVVGSLNTSEAVAQDFEAHRFNPDYNYYALLKGGIVYAVMGLQKPYHPEDPSWQQEKPGSAEFKDQVDLVASLPLPDAVTFGAYILDSQGNRIGTWFSSMIAGVEIDQKDHSVSITTAKPWINKQ